MKAIEPNVFSGLANIMPWPYLLCDREGTILFTNAHFDRLLEVDVDVSKGIELCNIFHSDDQASSVEKVLKQVTPQEAWHGKWNFTENGERLTLELVAQVDPSNDNLVWVIALENPVINNQMVLSTRSELRLLQILMDHTLDYVFFKDIGGRFIITNSAFQKALNVPFPGYEIGKKLSDFVDPETAVSFQDTDHKVLTTYRPIINHVGMFRLNNGEGRWLQTTKMPVFNQNNKCIGLVCVSRDISESKENEEKLKQAIAKANQANQAKSDFLANMSHEVRTPINGIVGMTELCLETDLGKEQSGYLKSVINCSNTLLAIVNDILDFSKIEAGQLKLEKIRFNMIQCIEECVEQFMPQSREKAIELVLQLDSSLPAQVDGDPIRLTQILNNLLSNAIKFTEEGEILVRAETVEQTDGVATIKISVIDSGIGIPLDRQKVIFESFTQADNSTTRKYGGTGLGLAICKQLVELMGGEIRVDSTGEKGAKFEVTIKLTSSEPQAGLPKEFLSELKELSVLIIDDNKTNRAILMDLCSHWDFIPRAAASGLEGLEKLEKSMHGEHPIQLVLLDQQMPSLSGLDVAALIKNRPLLRNVKMILLSSSLTEEETERASKIGINSFLSKPVKQSVLLNVILEQFREEKLSEPVEKRILPFAGTRPPFKSEEAPVQMIPMTILMAEDNPVNQEVSLQRLEKLGHEVLIVENGKKAVEAYREAKFDLILMDVQMPIMDGFAATREIRKIENEKGYYTPIIAMTARAMKGDESRCLEAGMDAYMAKPFRASKLFSLLETVFIAAHEKEEEVVAKGTVIFEPGASPLKLDDLVDGLSKEDGEDLKAAGRVFLEHYENDLELLKKYLDENDMEMLNHQAHSIKGGAGIFEAQRLQTLALSIERAALEKNRSSIESTLPLLEREIHNLAKEIKRFSYLEG